MDATATDIRPRAQADLAAIGKAWLARFDVVLSTTDHKRLSGLAHTRGRAIKSPWPSSTLARLYVLAHEIGHVALRHDEFCPLPEYAREFEAELFAHVLLRTEGLAVPVRQTERAKRYVRRFINRALDGGLDELDPSIMHWADPGFYNVMRCMRPNVFRPGGKRYFVAAKKRVSNTVLMRGSS